MSALRPGGHQLRPALSSGQDRAGRPCKSLSEPSPETVGKRLLGKATPAAPHPAWRVGADPQSHEDASQTWLDAGPHSWKPTSSRQGESSSSRWCSPQRLPWSLAHRHPKATGGMSHAVGETFQAPMKGLSPCPPEGSVHRLGCTSGRRACLSGAAENSGVLCASSAAADRRRDPSKGSGAGGCRPPSPPSGAGER